MKYQQVDKRKILRTDTSKRSLMDETKEIVKANFTNYNKKLVFQDSILIISLLFIVINYLLVIEPNYSSNKELAYRTKRIQTYTQTINGYKSDILKNIPDSAKNLISLADSDFVSEQAIDKLKPYFETQNQKDLLSTKVNNIRSAVSTKDTLTSKNEDLKKKISDSKDALSLVKVLLFINDGREHSVLFLSFVILVVLIYFYLTRKYLLNLLSRTLRIQKEKISFNDYYEYSLNYSVWLTPIPDKNSYSIDSNEILNALAIKNTHSSYKKVMIVVFIVLILLQLRLYFIELETNNISFTIYSCLSFICVISTIVLTYLWLTQNIIPDNFNSEQSKIQGLKRRDFLCLSIGIIPVSIVALSIPALKLFGNSTKSSKLYNRLYNDPRFVSSKKNKSLSKVEDLKFEKECLDLVAIKQYDKCVNLLILRIRKKANSKNYIINEQAIRLSDLLIRVLMFIIYRNGEIKYEAELVQLKQILDNSSNQILQQKIRLLNSPNYKWKAVCRDEKSIIKWNRVVFT